MKSRQSTQSETLESGIAVWIVVIWGEVREGKHNFTISDEPEPKTMLAGHEVMYNLCHLILKKVHSLRLL